MTLHQATALVPGGTLAHSTNYTGIFTLGQTPGGNTVSKSTSYILHGGVVGATQ